MKFYVGVFSLALLLVGCGSNQHRTPPQSVQDYRDKLVSATKMGEDISSFSGFRAFQVRQGTQGAVCYQYELPRQWFYDMNVIFVNGKVDSWASPGDCDNLLRQNGFSREIRPGGEASDITIRAR
jgi:hypothetical protein